MMCSAKGFEDSRVQGILLDPMDPGLLEPPGSTPIQGEKCSIWPFFTLKMERARMAFPSSLNPFRPETP